MLYVWTKFPQCSPVRGAICSARSPWRLRLVRRLSNSSRASSLARELTGHRYTKTCTQRMHSPVPRSRQALCNGIHNCPASVHVQRPATVLANRGSSAARKPTSCKSSMLASSVSPSNDATNDCFCSFHARRQMVVCIGSACPPVNCTLVKTQLSGYSCQPIAGSPAHNTGEGVYPTHAPQFP